MHGQLIPPRVPRIAHIITGLFVGGAETQLAALVRIGKQSSLEESVVSLLAGGPIAEEIKSAGVPVTELRGRSGQASIRLGIMLSQVIQEINPDIVVSWLYHANLY